jgi:DNA-binding transcriptional MerR regulator
MAFYRIKEAAEKIGVLPHVLRFWESQFPAMRPEKTSRGQRLFADSDIENFLKIKHLLYNEGYSIPGAKKALKVEKAGDKAVNQSLNDVVEKELLRSLVSELKDFQNQVKEL